MIAPDAMDELVVTLLEGTRAGTIRWNTADSRGRAFIAKRPSGTVTLSRGYGLVGTGFRLMVRDRSGNAVGEVIGSESAYESAAKAVMDGLARSAGSNAVARANLNALFIAIQAQLANADSTLRSLASEFRSG
jgi:hypothetical protein